MWIFNAREHRCGTRRTSSACVSLFVSACRTQTDVLRKTVDPRVYFFNQWIGVGVAYTRAGGEGVQEYQQEAGDNLSTFNDTWHLAELNTCW